MRLSKSVGSVEIADFSNGIHRWQ